MPSSSHFHFHFSIFFSFIFFFFFFRLMVGISLSVYLHTMVYPQDIALARARARRRITKWKGACIGPVELSQPTVHVSSDTAYTQLNLSHHWETEHWMCQVFSEITMLVVRPKQSRCTVETCSRLRDRRGRVRLLRCTETLYRRADCERGSDCLGCGFWEGALTSWRDEMLFRYQTGFARRQRQLSSDCHSRCDMLLSSNKTAPSLMRQIRPFRRVSPCSRVPAVMGTERSSIQANSSTTA